ncbi:MAG: hypothetical protein ACLP8Y_00335 [Thermoplasmata archaeon]
MIESSSRAAPSPVGFPPRAPAVAASPPEMESWQESFFAALPLFIVGGVCVTFAVYLYLAGASTTFGADGSVHLRPWVLFVALGITGIAAGTVALWVEDAPAAPREVPKAPVPSKTPPPPKAKAPHPLFAPRKGYPGPTVQELATLSDRVNLTQSSPAARSTAPSPPPSPSRPAVSAALWDEDLIGLDERTPEHEEVWDTDSSPSSGPVAERMRPDAVLKQLDEIEASLRKKTAAARTH